MKKEGEFLTAYFDYQFEKKPIGYVQLLKYIDTGLPFIIKDYDEVLGKKTPIAYNSLQLYTYEVWNAIVVDNKINNNCYYPKNSIIRVKIKVPYQESNKDITEEDDVDYWIDDNLTDNYNGLY